MTLKVVGWIAALSFAPACRRRAQTYPTREIRVIVGLPAGSGGDVVARYYADKLSQLAGKPVIVENKPGMIMSIGADAVAKAPPDGHTILITSVTSSHAANVYNFKKLPYDPIKDFTPVATLQKSYFILMVREGAPWKTVNELTEAMKTQGREGDLRLWRAAGARVGRALQGPQGAESGRHPVQDLDGVAAGDVQRRDRFPVHRCSTAGTPLLHDRQGARARGHLGPARCRASIFRPWPRRPTFRSSISRRCGACCCRPERRQPIVAKLEVVVRRDQQDGRDAAISRHHPCGAVSGNAKALADFLPKEIKKWEELAKLAKIEPQ